MQVTQVTKMWVLVLAVVLPGCDTTSASRPSDGAVSAGDPAAVPASPAATAGGSADAAAQAAYDLRFIDSMTAHHEHGIEMSQMAVSKAGSAEVREIAQKMVDDQRRDTEELSSWRERWFSGAANAHDMTMPGMSSMNMDMSKLQTASGHDFDHAFLEMMVPHHEGAMAMGRDGSSNAEHQELRRKAQEIADKQQRELDEIQKLRESMAAH